MTPSYIGTIYILGGVMLLKIFLLLIFSTVAYADLLTKVDLTYKPEYAQTHSADSLSFLTATENAVKNSNELAKIKEQRDDAALNLSKALNSMLPEIKATASKNNLDKSRPDYTEKAINSNYIARIKLKQILFSDSMIADMSTAEYKTNAQRLAAESMRLDIIRETADIYFAVSEIENLAQISDSTLSRLDNLKKQLISAKAPANSIKLIDKEIKAEQTNRNRLKKELSANFNRLSSVTGFTLTDRCDLENPSEAAAAKTLRRLIVIFESITHDSNFTNIEEFFTAKAIQDSQELKYLDEIILLNRREVKSEKLKYSLPDVAVSGEYTQYIDKSEDETEFDTNFNKNDWNLNLSLSMPVFDGKKTSPSLTEKHAELMETLHRRAQIKEAVKTRMQSAVAQTKYAAEAHKKAEKTKSSAADRLKEYKLLYSKKKISTESLISATVKAGRAEKESAKAYYRLHGGLIALQRAYGKFFAYNGDYEDERFIKELEDSIVRN